MPRNTREKAQITGHLKKTQEKRNVQRVSARVKTPPRDVFDKRAVEKNQIRNARKAGGK